MARHAQHITQSTRRLGTLTCTGFLACVLCSSACGASLTFFLLAFSETPFTAEWGLPLRAGKFMTPRCACTSPCSAWGRLACHVANFRSTSAAYLPPAAMPAACRFTSAACLARACCPAWNAFDASACGQPQSHLLRMQQACGVQAHRWTKQGIGFRHNKAQCVFVGICNNGSS